MNDYKFSDNVKMEPWIGSEYKKQEVRTLILGLSVYTGYIKKNRVKDMISDIKENTYGWTHFFTKIYKAFNLKDFEKSEFWDSVAFYEYLLYAFQEPKQKIEEHHWDDAVKPFNEVITKIKPDVILVMGNKNYERLPDHGEYYKTIKSEDLEMEVWRYEYANKDMYVCKIPHPSNGRGFSPESWKKVYAKFYKQISKLINVEEI